MSDRDNDAERFDDVEDESDGTDCTCGENEACDECAGETEEDRPVSVDLTRAEALTLLHVAWNKEIEMAAEQSTAGLSQVMGSIGTQVGLEIYGPEMTAWLQERQEEREEMMEEMMDQMGGMFGSDDPLEGGSGRVGFQ
ncbi:hypothetical protein HVTV-2_gp78 [Haloarcula virus HVTV-2]|uniref:Uncharacterized protein n=1 Tax=Haloarcula vallismortis tailed virus 1 TaxID=1262528 RepID=L7TJ82_9CAUD|nr:hypothetical protein HVTV1_79 [Haloarcula vallismortis tailed virus 1]AGC34448.1 hypothetical protein HVTV1_79 [Haloarcula vallismortis tailed virus 1]UBF22885.1 hypothetical protein HVTV-2_gp78 [Haloarcula virus HVTV-2]